MIATRADTTTTAPPDGTVFARRRCGMAAVVDHRPGRAPSARAHPQRALLALSWLQTIMTSMLPSDHSGSNKEWKGALGWSPRLYGDCRVCSSESFGEGIGIARASSGLRCSSAQKPCVVVLAKANLPSGSNWGCEKTASEVSKRLLYVWHACEDLLCSRGGAADARGG